MKICVYAISKNESLFAKRFCESARDADMIFVADTGSTDDTVSILEECGATVGHISIWPWRFDDARNAALAMVPENFDICVSLDLDETLEPGWRHEIERLWVNGTNRIRYQFDWGNGLQFQSEKIHARYGFRWASPCHEVIVPDRTEEVWANTNMLLVVHKPDHNKSRGQYLDILSVGVAENPNSPRHSFYYGRELKFNGRWQEAIDECNRYLSLPNATWNHERGYACRVLGECYQALNNWDDAVKWHRLAVTEVPHARESWCALALCCYRMSRWTECYGAAITCLAIETKEHVYTMDPEVWGAKPHDLAAIGAWNLGLYEVALNHAKKALALDPDEFRLRENVKFMQEKVDSLRRPAVDDAA